MVKQHLLGGLSDSDADLFLRRVPIEDASVCARIVTAAEGLPFYLDLAADTYERIVNQSGTPAAEDFGASRPEILARFLDHLEREEVEVLKLTAHARLLDEPLLLHLCERFLGGAATCDFGRLADYSFMTPQVDGRLVMHALMREELQRRDRAERPELFKRIHEVLFDWHDAKATIEHPRDITSSHEASLKEAAYHLPFFDLMRFPRWIGERGKRFFDGARYELIAPLYQRAVEIGETALGPAGSEMAVCTANLAELCRRQGRYAEAEQLFRRAVELGEKAWGPEHPALAEILNNLGLLQWNRGYYAEAEPLLARTLVVREKSLGPEHPDVSESLNDLSLVYRSQGRYGEAELLRQRALAIREKVLGPEHPEVAESLNSLAGLYRLQGRHAEAEALYQRALVISEQALGPEHPVVATRLNNLAGLYRNQGRHAEAEPLYERAIAIGEKPGSGDPLVTAVGHPRV